MASSCGVCDEPIPEPDFLKVVRTDAFKEANPKLAELMQARSMAGPAACL